MGNFEVGQIRKRTERHFFEDILKTAEVETFFVIVYLFSFFFAVHNIGNVILPIFDDFTPVSPNRGRTRARVDRLITSLQVGGLFNIPSLAHVSGVC